MLKVFAALMTISLASSSFAYTTQEYISASERLAEGSLARGIRADADTAFDRQACVAIGSLDVLTNQDPKLADARSFCFFTVGTPASREQALKSLKDFASVHGL